MRAALIYSKIKRETRPVSVERSILYDDTKQWQSQSQTKYSTRTTVCERDIFCTLHLGPATVPNTLDTHFQFLQLRARPLFFLYMKPYFHSILWFCFARLLSLLMFVPPIFVTDFSFTCSIAFFETSRQSERKEKKTENKSYVSEKRGTARRFLAAFFDSKVNFFDLKMSSQLLLHYIVLCEKSNLSFKSSRSLIQSSSHYSAEFCCAGRHTHRLVSLISFYFCFQPVMSEGLVSSFPHERQKEPKHEINVRWRG